MRARVTALSTCLLLLTISTSARSTRADGEETPEEYRAMAAARCEYYIKHTAAPVDAANRKESIALSARGRDFALRGDYPRAADALKRAYALWGNDEQCVNVSTLFALGVAEYRAGRRLDAEWHLHEYAAEETAEPEKLVEAEKLLAELDKHLGHVVIGPGAMPSMLMLDGQPLVRYYGGMRDGATLQRVDYFWNNPEMWRQIRKGDQDWITIVVVEPGFHEITFSHGVTENLKYERHAAVAVHAGEEAVAVFADSALVRRTAGSGTAGADDIQFDRLLSQACEAATEQGVPPVDASRKSESLELTRSAVEMANRGAYGPAADAFKRAYALWGNYAPCVNVETLFMLGAAEHHAGRHVDAYNDLAFFASQLDAEPARAGMAKEFLREIHDRVAHVRVGGGSFGSLKADGAEVRGVTAAYRPDEPHSTPLTGWATDAKSSWLREFAVAPGAHDLAADGTTVGRDGAPSNYSVHASIVAKAGEQVEAVFDTAARVVP